MLSRFKQLSESVTEQLEAVGRDSGDAGQAGQQKPAEPLLGIITSQRDRFKAR